MAKDRNLITHHIKPANVHQNGGKKGKETVEIDPRFEKNLHRIYVNMSPGRMFVFTKVIFVDNKDRKWTRRRINRLRKAIIKGEMSPQNKILADLIDNNQLQLFIELSMTMMYIMSPQKRQLF